MSTIFNPKISEQAQIPETAVVINSKFGKYTSVGSNTWFCYSELGDFSYISGSSHIYSTHIAKFSSISWNVSVNPAYHDIKRFTQHPMLFAKKFGMLPLDGKEYYKQYDEVTIGNDVWIGCNSLIMGGVSIGDGAVIGAGARVSHDVPPYAIIVGNNNHIRNRFSEDIISELLNLCWWDLSFDKIKAIIPFLAEQPNKETISKIRELISL